MVATSGKSATKKDSQTDQREYAADGDVTEKERADVLKKMDSTFVRKMLGVVADDPERRPEMDRHKRKSSSTKKPTGKRAKGHKKEHQALTFRRIKN